MSQMQEEAKATLEHAADKMAWYYNRWRSPAPVYKVGAKVWLNAQNYTTTCPTKKLDHKWLGPFVIKKVVSPAAVKLRLSPHEQGVHLVISISNVHPYLPDPIPECPLDPQPNPILVNGSEEYEVESIVDSKYRYRHLHYLIKFRGWPDSDNEWLPADHLANTPDAIRDFHLRHPSTPAPCPMSRLQWGGPS
jgi:Chromo (CHRromatin Organisation MOdifier) domain